MSRRLWHPEYNENVLDPSETDDAPETHRYQAYYAGDEAASSLPQDTNAEGMDQSTDNERYDDDGYGAPPTHHQSEASTYSQQRHTNGSQEINSIEALLAASSINAHHQIEAPTRKRMVTAEGVPVTAVNEKTWREIQQLCNIESGPNLVQRVENASRGIGEAR